MAVIVYEINYLVHCKWILDTDTNGSGEKSSDPLLLSAKINKTEHIFGKFAKVIDF